MAGNVLIEVIVDEQGNVASVDGVTGEPVLVEGRFSGSAPMEICADELSGNPVRVIGRLRFSLSSQPEGHKCLKVSRFQQSNSQSR